MNWLIAFALQFTGVPYIYGGSHPEQGLDCSGYVQILLKASGMDLPGDQNAQMMFDYFSNTGEWNSCKAGALVFFGSDAKHISHVAFCIDSWFMMESAGGDSTTTSKEEAIRRGAMVRLSRIDSRKDRIAIIRPRYPFSI